MTGLTAIENGPYVSPMSLILTKVEALIESFIGNYVINQE